MANERRERRTDIVRIGGGEPKNPPERHGFTREPVTLPEGPKRPAGPARTTR